MNQKRIADGVDPARDGEKIKHILTTSYLGSPSLAHTCDETWSLTHSRDTSCVVTLAETHDLMRRNKELNGKKIKGGTTVVTALIIESILYVAHVGDSRAVLYAIEESEEVHHHTTISSRSVIARVHACIELNLMCNVTLGSATVVEAKDGN
jgi:serine/threonine protein phosphatase PrpC